MKRLHYELVIARNNCMRYLSCSVCKRFGCEHILAIKVWLHMSTGLSSARIGVIYLTCIVSWAITVSRVPWMHDSFGKCQRYELHLPHIKVMKFLYHLSCVAMVWLATYAYVYVHHIYVRTYMPWWSWSSNSPINIPNHIECFNCYHIYNAVNRFDITYTHAVNKTNIQWIN